jgi:glycosyltransferase involved in cell wall biosynthesis
MKILHVIDSGGLFGAENVLLSLVGQQVLNGLFPIIGSINSSKISEKALEIEATARDFKVHKFFMRPGLNIFGAHRIIKYAKENNIDIIHSHGYKPNILLGLQPHFYRKIPVLSTMHGWTSTQTFSKIRINQELDAFALRFVDKIVLVSKGMLRNKKINKLPSNKLHIIENGIDIKPYDNSAINKESIFENHIHDKELRKRIISFCKNSIIIGSIGRLSKEKGFDYLIEAIYLLRKNNVLNNNVKLLIIGEGNQNNYLSELVQRYDWV